MKIPKILKWKYAGPGWLYFYEAQRFISVTDNAKFPSYIGTWPLQVTFSRLRRGHNSQACQCFHVFTDHPVQPC